jgi:hypothetical protein
MTTTEQLGLFGGQGSARLSNCGRYRYQLRRRWSDDGDEICWVMLNPSTADESEDDPTIRRCISFSKRWGYGRLVVVNLFAWRATSPEDVKRELKACKASSGIARVLGPKNRAHRLEAMNGSAVVVAAWGASLKPWSTMRARMISYEVANGECHPLQCLGTTKDGSPRHPLYVAGTTELVPWRAKP